MFKKGFILLVLVVMVVSSVAGCGNSASKDPLIGVWTDENDTVEFYDDGTFSSYYYWIGGGQWSRAEDDENKIELLNNILGKERHRVTITEDRLVLTQQKTDVDGEESDTKMDYEFTRKTQ